MLTFKNKISFSSSQYTSSFLKSTIPRLTTNSLSHRVTHVFPFQKAQKIPMINLKSLIILGVETQNDVV